MKNEEEEKIRTMYEKLYKEELGKSRALLEQEIDEYFNLQFKEKLRVINQENNTKGEVLSIEDIKNQIEAEHQLIETRNKSEWENEKESIRQRTLKVLETEMENQLKTTEEKAKKQQKIETDAILDQAKKEILEEFDKNIREIKEKNEEKIKILSNN